MTIKRRPRPQRRRQLTALALAIAIPWLVAVTAASDTGKAALSALGQQGDLALHILRGQLGDSREEDALPASVSLAIGQSPVLLAGRTEILDLRRSQEDDTPDSQPQQEEPITETPEEPETPLVFADNGVTARTLVPTSTDGYIVAGDVYISNGSVNTFDASLFDGTFAARLS